MSEVERGIMKVSILKIQDILLTLLSIQTLVKELYLMLDFKILSSCT
ncbi:hypothetical protein ACQV2T_02265 [Facklamia sp. P13069]